MVKFQEIDVTCNPWSARVIWVEEGGGNAQEIEALSAVYSCGLSAIMEGQRFTGRAGSSLLTPVVREGKLGHLLLVGIGTHTVSLERYRRALGSAVRAAERASLIELVVPLPRQNIDGLGEEMVAQETAATLGIASYFFDQFITDEERKRRIESLIIVPGAANKQGRALSTAIDRGVTVARGVNKCRSWVDLPPAYLTPLDLSTIATNIAAAHGMKCQLFNEAEISAMGMGGLAAVSRGSDKDCQFVVMEYLPLSGGATVAFVGKGITFDSGGLSIKPAEAMETMKGDMAGAAAVLAAVEVIATLRLPINIVALLPLSENIPGSKATKPGDIVRFYNGKTAEVKNTDAEGRLILADALSYAEKHYTLDAIVDLATLTGACSNALGPFFSGLMGNDVALIERLLGAGNVSGDRLWRLPFDDDYRAAIKSAIADMQNIGNRRYMAGATTAGLFLSNFVAKTRWAHIDIAGTAQNVPDISYFRPEGATGVGVRLLVAFAQQWIADHRLGV